MCLQSYHFFRQIVEAVAYRTTLRLSQNTLGSLQWLYNFLLASFSVFWSTLFTPPNGHVTTLLISGNSRSLARQSNVCSLWKSRLVLLTIGSALIRLRRSLTDFFLLLDQSCFYLNTVPKKIAIVTIVTNSLVNCPEMKKYSR